MNRRTKKEQSNAGIGSALQGGGRPKVKRINTSFDEILANTSPAIQQEVAMEFAVSNRIYEFDDTTRFDQTSVCSGSWQETE